MMHLLLFVLRPRALVMQPLVHTEESDHSDHEAELLTPGLIVFLTQAPSWQI